jgi:hypothetical protein
MEVGMDWVLIYSLLWVVGGVPTPPTTSSQVNYKTEELCQAAAKAVKAEMTKPIDAGVETYARIVCVRRK